MYSYKRLRAICINTDGVSVHGIFYNTVSLFFFNQLCRIGISWELPHTFPIILTSRTKGTVGVVHDWIAVSNMEYITSGLHFFGGSN